MQGLIALLGNAVFEIAQKLGPGFFGQTYHYGIGVLLGFLWHERGMRAGQNAIGPQPRVQLADAVRADDLHLETHIGRKTLHMAEPVHLLGRGGDADAGGRFGADERVGPAQNRREELWRALGGAGARFQPVYVGDVSRAILAAIDQDLGIGGTYEIAGSDVWTLAQLVDYAARLGGHRPLIVPLPRSLAMLQATVLSWLPGGLMSPDNVRSMDRDNVASGAAQPFGLTPTALDAVAPAWLGNRTQRGRYARLRTQPRRAP